MSTFLIPAFADSPTRWLTARMALLAGCVTVADFLLYLHEPGVSIVLFFAFLGVMVTMASPVRAHVRTLLLASLMLIVALTPMIEHFNALSLAFGVLGLSLFALNCAAFEGENGWRRIGRAASLPFFSLPWMTKDLLRMFQLSRNGKLRLLQIGSLTAWVIPVALFAVFVYLLASANPLIEKVIEALDFGAGLDSINFTRMSFWLATLVAIWPLLHLRAGRARRAIKPVDAASSVAHPSSHGLFGTDAILRSLVLFNALFGLQTGLDIAYLWGGVALPDGMSYAAYAHRGAYPLAATALLAAIFVLLAMRKDGPARQSKLIRTLVLVWTAQNVVLVISSILRLDLYVAAYSLTYLRIVAFIWMMLVAVGLALIFMQVIRDKPLSWLIERNAFALALTLFACCFLNAPKLVADYNVAHSREFGGVGPRLDLSYLLSLGPQALPAVDRYASRQAGSGNWSPEITSWRWQMVVQVNTRSRDWRSWTFRAWRLNRYLANNSPIASIPRFSAQP